MDSTQPSSPRIIQLLQDNRQRKIRVHGATSAACEWLGYKMEELRSLPVTKLFDSAIATELEDDINYEFDGVDTAEVLGRYRELVFRNAMGQACSSHATISFAGLESMQPLFNLRLEAQDPVLQSRRAASKLAERMHHKAPNTLDPETRLPNADSFHRDLVLTLDVMDELSANAILLMARPQAIPADIPKMLTLLGAAARASFRATDVIARAHPRALGIILMDVTTDDAVVPIQRFQKMIEKQVPVNVTLAAAVLLRGGNAEVWQARLSKAVEEMPHNPRLVAL